MKIPKTPPPWHDILGQMVKDPEKQGWFTEKQVPHSDEYLHWDKLRHLTPPEGLSSKEWWALLKLRRTAQFQLIPLQDKKENPFRFFLTQTMFEGLHKIDLRAGGSIEMLEEVTNSETRDRYYVSSLMEESITSSLLEGAATTRSDAKQFLRSGREPATLAQRMVVNNYRTMQSLVDLKNQPFSMDRIFEIHQTISKGTLESPDQEGRMRRDDETIDIGNDLNDEVYHTPPRAAELPARMQALCDFANEEKMDGFLHPVIRSIIVHFWLAYDHPFVDGNGRTARALFYWSMLRHGFWLFEFISISRILNQAPAKYGRSFLETETDENDLNYFILHQLEVISRAIDELHAYLQRKRKEITSSSELLQAQSVLNHRQIAIIQRAMREPGSVFTIKSHQTSHNVVYQTARTDLLTLAEKDLLEQKRVKNQLIFVAPNDVGARLQKLVADL